jgi:DNA-binding protein YbaB
MALLGTLGSLNVLLSADTAQFSSAMDKAAYVAERDLQKISFKGKAGIAAITTAIVAAGTAIAVSVKKTIDHADEIGEMAPSLGLAVEQLSSLEYASKLSGLGMEDLRTSFQKFNNTIFDEAKAIKENSGAFKSLGISLTDSNGKLRNNYDLFLDTAEALSEMADGAQKSAIAQDLFGKSGAKMIPLLNSGKEGIKKLTEEASKLGVTFSQDTVAAADKFNDNMTRMASVSQGLIASFTSGLLPTLANLTDNINSSTEALESFKEAGEGVAIIIVALVNTSKVLIDTFKTLMDTLGAGAAQMALILNFKFKEAMEVGRLYTEDQSKRWSDLAISLDKNWNAISDTVKDGSSQTTKSLLDVSGSVVAFNKKQEEGRNLVDSLRTSQEKYNDEMAKYRDLLDSGAISQETFERAAKKSKETLEKNSEVTNRLKDGAKNLGFTFQSAFEDAIIAGKKFSDVLSSLLEDIERVILRTMITEPLANAISSGISSFFSTPNSTSTTASRHGNIFSGGMLVPFASGGLITRPSIFPMANGGVGLAGEAGTEAIMPLFRTGSGDLGVKSSPVGVEVNVYAPEGSSIKTNSQKSGNKQQINVMIDEAVAGSVNSPGSKTYKALKNSFGLRQQLTMR